ncbi:hypothetical protein [Flavobacterium chilense]|uniref:Uncharacterized protein n=1 Tax=Flavobacterium chilense TaxID=946677 RepID=A0A1M7FB84_9FLAO|nr:hypothetical protein [Flavobacterium chilense]SHM01215.1 hypothetical protein SAMN05444484_103303 [Flavobacterium chilense]
MKENILLLLQIITVDFFTAFGLYSILFLIVSIFLKKPLLAKIDDEAVKFISLVGIIYFTIWIIGIFVFYAENNPEEKISMINRMFGKYWIGFWSQYILWFVITQSLRFRRIRKNVLLRILFSFLFILSIEKIIILTVTFHRDYLPSSWTMYSDLNIYPSNFLLSLLMKIILFLLFVGIYYVIKNQIQGLIKPKRV